MSKDNFHVAALALGICSCAGARTAAAGCGSGCFQVHRIFSQTGADTSWNNAEVLFAWNCWGGNKRGNVDEIGIGTFAAQIEAASNKNPVNPVNPVRTSFPIAAVTNCISSVAFVGDTLFTSMIGDCRYEIIGFVADEALVLSNNVQVVLDAAKAAWLNKCAGGKATVADAVAGIFGISVSG